VRIRPPGRSLPAAAQDGGVLVVRIAEALVGGLLVLATWWSVLVTLVVRGARSR
jgi:hypothetical protein